MRSCIIYSGKRFVSELARLFQAFATDSPYEVFAIQTTMTLPALVLQKPHAKSKTQGHISCLHRRLALREEGDKTELLREGKAIQKNLQASSLRGDTKGEAKTARKFSKLMMEGKVRAALRLLTKQTQAGLLGLDQVIEVGSSTPGRTVREILEEKHPDASPAYMHRCYLKQ